LRVSKRAGGLFLRRGQLMPGTLWQQPQARRIGTKAALPSSASETAIDEMGHWRDDVRAILAARFNQRFVPNCRCRWIASDVDLRVSSCWL
jgi:hypothetical protein